jgi:hypothetical protein
MEIPDDWLEFVELLNERKVDYLLVGGHAVAVYGHSRLTQNIDFLIQNSEDNYVRILEALKEFGFGSLGVTVEDFRNSFVIQLGVAPYRIDLLTKLDGIEIADAFRDAQRLLWRGVDVAVISKNHLIQNKLATGRPRDLDDVESLRKPGSR